MTICEVELNYFFLFKKILAVVQMIQKVNNDHSSCTVVFSTLNRVFACETLNTLSSNPAFFLKTCEIMYVFQNSTFVLTVVLTHLSFNISVYSNLKFMNFVLTFKNSLLN